MKKSIITLFLLANVGVAAQAQTVNSITNGSLTSNFSGWTVQQTPDIGSLTQAPGAGLSKWVVMPESASPDGGSWAGMGTLYIPTSGYQVYESFSQTVSGLTAGQSYTVSWYAGNFGLDTSGNGGNVFTQANAIGVTVNGALVGQGQTLALGSKWYAESVTFVATSTSAMVGFRPANLPAGTSYMSIDGITLTPTVAAIPEPGTLAMMGLGLAGLAFSRVRARKAAQG